MEKQNQAVDKEWEALLREARHLGLSIQDIRRFFQENKVQELQGVKE
ncbi:anti-repressor SinI family protein [Halobacillus litoralis]|nr:anti-repressor SinI family protein [Halobacillus litoralis]